MSSLTIRRIIVWAVSMGEELLGWPEPAGATGFVWGVRWQRLYPGGTVVTDTERAARWSDEVGVRFMAARIETEAHAIELVFRDLDVSEVPYGTVPFEVTRDV